MNLCAGTVTLAALLTTNQALTCDPIGDAVRGTLVILIEDACLLPAARTGLVLLLNLKLALLNFLVLIAYMS